MAVRWPIPLTDVITYLLHWWRMRGFVPTDANSIPSKGWYRSLPMHGAAGHDHVRGDTSANNLMSDRDLYSRRFSVSEFTEHSDAEQHDSCSNVPGKDIRLFSEDAGGYAITWHLRLARIMINARSWQHEIIHDGGLPVMCTQKLCTALCILRIPTSPFLFSSFCYYTAYTTICSGHSVTATQTL